MESKKKNHMTLTNMIGMLLNGEIPSVLLHFRCSLIYLFWKFAYPQFSYISDVLFIT